MGFGLVVYDVLYLTLAALLYGGAIAVGLRAQALLSRGAPFPVACALAVLVGIVALIAAVGVLSALCPRLAPGRYKLMRGSVFWGWMLRSMLRRILWLPGLRWILFSSNVLRFLTLRALGARTAFTASFSADAELLDPSLLEVGPGAIVGARCIVAGHWVQDGELVLDRVVIGARAMLAGEVIVGPGCVIGERALIKVGAALGVAVQVGERAEVGARANVDSGSRLGARCHIGSAAYVPAKSVVPDDAQWEAGESLSARRIATPG